MGWLWAAEDSGPTDGIGSVPAFSPRKPSWASPRRGETLGLTCRNRLRGSLDSHFDWTSSWGADQGAEAVLSTKRVQVHHVERMLVASPVRASNDSVFVGARQRHKELSRAVRLSYSSLD